MNINRNNYEEFFLLYADNELSATEKQQVEHFAAAHPDLKAELDMLLQAVLPIESQAVFLDKESLFRTTDTDSLVNMTNYEGYFVRYTDDELTNTEKAATEEFVYKHPECQSEFELIQLTRIHPDTNISFPDKNLLYRKTTEERPVIMLWMRFAAAAVIILLAGLFWLQQRRTLPETANHAELANAAKPVETKKMPEQAPIQEPDVAKQTLATTVQPANPVQQPKKKSNGNQLPAVVEKNELVVNETPVAKPENQAVRAIDPTAGISIAATELPKAEIKQPAVTETNKLPEAVYASNAASEDYIYVDNSQPVRKSPLRGLLRKASRYVEQKNPLSPEHKKGGVFTASQEQ